MHEHSQFWFEENFKTKELNGLQICYGTCNGMDYSFTSDTEENARLLAEAYLKKNGHLFDQRRNEIFVLKDSIDKLHKEHDLHVKEILERSKSKLLSVYYMLDAISKTGTHREKQTIIMYQKVVLEDLINKGDSWPVGDDRNLPF